MAETLRKILQPSDEDKWTSTVESDFTMTPMDSPPSCLEFVPSSTAYPHHLVAGTYSLDPTMVSLLDEDEGHDAVQSRSGSLVLLNLKDNEL